MYALSYADNALFVNALIEIRHAPAICRVSQETWGRLVCGGLLDGIMPEYTCLTECRLYLCKEGHMSKSTLQQAGAGRPPDADTPASLEASDMHA